MKNTFVFKGREILEQIQETPLKSIQEYVGYLVTGLPLESGVTSLNNLEVGSIKIFEKQPKHYDKALIHKLSQDTFAIALLETQPSGVVYTRLTVLKYTPEMLPLFKHILDDEFTLNHLFPKHLLEITQGFALLSVAKADSPYTTEERKFWKLKEKLYLIEATNEPSIQNTFYHNK